MAHHLQHGAADAEGVDGTNAQKHESHVAYGAAGDPSLDVVLSKGIQGAIDDIDDPEDDERWRQGQMRVRKHLNIESQQGVAAHLEQDAGEEHRNRSVGFPMGVRQPGVKREHRQFDAEADEEAQVAEKSKTSTR